MPPRRGCVPRPWERERVAVGRVRVVGNSAGSYKDFAPDGAFGRSTPVSAGPVAAGGWAEAVKNILRRGFANVLRLGFATAAHRRKAVADGMQLLQS
jgi:hypothetical protein